MGTFPELVGRIGPLRFMLQGLAFVFIILSQFVGSRSVYSGWEIIPTLVVPALVPIIFFGMLLELMMSTVFMVDAEDVQKKTRFKTIIKIDIAIIAGLLLFWVPALMQLLK
ncbi:MAG: hypothetical protein ACC641_10980 [Acidiferrobacterales bacterium]